MPILRSKLHQLNRKLQQVSTDVCTDKLWFNPRDDRLDIKLDMASRVRLLELEQLIQSIREDCDKDGY